jgi:hypothetical protein
MPAREKDVLRCRAVTASATDHGEKGRGGTGNNNHGRAGRMDDAEDGVPLNVVACKRNSPMSCIQGVGRAGKGRDPRALRSLAARSWGKHFCPLECGCQPDVGVTKEVKLPVTPIPPHSASTSTFHLE